MAGFSRELPVSQIHKAAADTLPWQHFEVLSAVFLISSSYVEPRRDQNEANLNFDGLI
jgi:hypothetical protein